MQQQSTINLSIKWSTGERTRHVDIRMYMLCDLNEQKLIQMEWVDGNKNSTDLGTKNLDIASHKKHMAALCGNNNFIQPILK